MIIRILVSAICVCLAISASTFGKQKLTNKMKIPVNAYVKVDGNAVQGAGRMDASSGKRVYYIPAESDIVYDLKGRVPKDEIMLIFEIEKVAMDAYNEMGAKLALGEIGEISGYRFNIPHHVEFSNPADKPDVYRLLIHFKKIKEIIREQLAPQLALKTFEEYCTITETGTYTCEDPFKKNKSFNNIGGKEFKDFILDINQALVTNLLVNYFEDIDPTIKHPEGF